MRRHPGQAVGSAVDSRRPASVWRSAVGAACTLAFALAPLATSAAAGAGSVGYQALQLRSLVSDDAPGAAQRLALSAAADRMASAGGGRVAVVYLWTVDLDNAAARRAAQTGQRAWRVQSQDLASLASEAARSMVLVMVVNGESDEQAAAVEKAILASAQAVAPALPIYAVFRPGDQTAACIELMAALRAKAKERHDNLQTPELFTLRRDDPDGTWRVADIRGDDPVRAGTWARLAAETGTVSNRDWFAPYLAQVKAAGIDLWGSPDAPIDEVQFYSLLEAAAHAAGLPPPATESPKPGAISRQAAISLVVRFLYGEKAQRDEGGIPRPAKAFPGSAEPERKMTKWEERLWDIPGASRIAGGRDGDLAQDLTFALAKGLLYYEPSLRPAEPLRRGEAAWLLARVLTRHGLADAEKGLLIDAVDLPVDPRAVRSTVEVFARGPGSAAPVRLLPAAGSERQSLQPCDAYAPVALVSATEYREGGGATVAKWVEQRIGAGTLPLQAEAVVWDGSLSAPAERQYRAPNGVLLPASSDAADVAARDRALRDWRAIVVYGAGVRLLSTDAPLERAHRPVFTLGFSQPMDDDTVTDASIWIEDEKTEAITKARVSAAEGFLVGGGITKVLVSPTEDLAHGRDYAIVLGTGLKTVAGGSLDLPLPRDGETPQPQKAGQARRLPFSVDPRVEAYLIVQGAPDGCEVTLPGEPEKWVPASGQVKFYAPEGKYTIGLRGPQADPQRRPSEHEVTVREGSYVVVPYRVPKAAKVTVTGLAKEVQLGVPVELRFAGTDDQGLPLGPSTPVPLKIEAEGCEMSPSADLTLPADSPVTLTPRRVGPLSLRVTAAVSGLAFSPPMPWSSVSYLARPDTVELSDGEIHRVPGGPQAEPAQLTPRWRRWFAASGQDPTLVQPAGATRKLQKTTGVPQPGQYAIDAAGYISVSRSAESPVTVQYPYRPGRCALILVTDRPDLRSGIERQLRDVLGLLGYGTVYGDAERELSEALGGRAPSRVSTLSPREAEALLRVLALDDVFLVTVQSRAGGLCTLRWRIWSAGPGIASVPEGRAEPEGPLPLTSKTETPLPAEGLLQVTKASLQTWLRTVGLAFSPAAPGR